MSSLRDITYLTWEDSPQKSSESGQYLFRRWADFVIRPSVAAVAAEHFETDHVRYPDDGASRYGFGVVLGAGRTLHRVFLPLAVPLHRSSFWLLVRHSLSLAKTIVDVTYQTRCPDTRRGKPARLREWLNTFPTVTLCCPLGRIWPGLPSGFHDNDP
jgi:hypothetical protein